VLHSTDLVTWTEAGDAMPVLPQWAVSGRKLTWAPAVTATSAGYALYYTARDRRSGLQCIGRAESASPAGPFVDRDSTAFICQAELGGSIDASVVRDSAGVMYLLWKSDGNCCSKPVTLWGQRLSDDGRRLEGRRAALLRRDQAWEGPLIEGPTMWAEDGVWHLLYSANRWDTDRYATGAAVCVSPVGPCRKTSTGPILASDTSVAGPGGAEVFTDLEGRRWLAYHGWSASLVGYRNGGVRSLRLDRVEAVGQAVVIVPTGSTPSLALTARP
jgi:beta-xylosidase